MGLIEPTVVGGTFHSFILRMSVSLGICYYAEKKFVEVREVAEGSEGSIWKGHYGYTRSFIPPEKRKKDTFRQKPVVYKKLFRETSREFDTLIKVSTFILIETPGNGSI